MAKHRQYAGAFPLPSSHWTNEWSHHFNATDRHSPCAGYQNCDFRLGDCRAYLCAIYNSRVSSVDQLDQPEGHSTRIGPRHHSCLLLYMLQNAKADAHDQADA